jgi:hypothetical protein
MWKTSPDKKRAEDQTPLTEAFHIRELYHTLVDKFQQILNLPKAGSALI